MSSEELSKAERRIKSPEYQRRLGVIKDLKKLLDNYMLLLFVFMLGGIVGHNDVVLWSALGVYWLGFFITLVLDIVWVRRSESRNHE